MFNIIPLTSRRFQMFPLEQETAPLPLHGRVAGPRAGSGWSFRNRWKPLDLHLPNTIDTKPKQRSPCLYVYMFLLLHIWFDFDSAILPSTDPIYFSWCREYPMDTHLWCIRFIAQLVLASWWQRLITESSKSNSVEHIQAEWFKCGDLSQSTARLLLQCYSFNFGSPNFLSQHLQASMSFSLSLSI